CPAIPEAKKRRIRSLLASRLSRDGRLRVVSYRERTQARNRAATEQKLFELLENAMRIPKTRRPTKPTAGSKRRRLADKRSRSELKRHRRARGEE
ncbi:MAG: aminoacyl-tRNA hydrolase, partial [Planctomycetes bacterium]|nr:aminoacyl-tRNA hydrolase [Planctomycetota bacterium]